MSDSEHCDEEIHNILRRNILSNTIPICEESSSVTSSEHSVASSVRSESEELETDNESELEDSMDNEDEPHCKGSFKRLDTIDQKILSYCKDLSIPELVKPRPTLLSPHGQHIEPADRMVHEVLPNENMTQVNAGASVWKCAILFVALLSIFINMYCQLYVSGVR